MVCVSPFSYAGITCHASTHVYLGGRGGQQAWTTGTQGQPAAPALDKTPTLALNKTPALALNKTPALTLRMSMSCPPPGFLRGAAGRHVPRAGPQLWAAALHHARQRVRGLLLRHGGLRLAALLQRRAELDPGLVHHHAGRGAQQLSANTRSGPGPAAATAAAIAMSRVV